jgi:hypothetical protein
MGTQQTNQSSAVAFNSISASRRDQSWFFATSLAASGFVAGGCIVFYLGCQSFAPSQPPPGQGNCGTAVLGGVFLMLCGAPIAALAAGCVGALVGIIVDAVQHGRD